MRASLAASGRNAGDGFRDRSGFADGTEIRPREFDVPEGKKQAPRFTGGFEDGLLVIVAGRWSWSARSGSPRREALLHQPGFKTSPNSPELNRRSIKKSKPAIGSSRSSIILRADRTDRRARRNYSAVAQRGTVSNGAVTSRSQSRNPFRIKPHLAESRDMGSEHRQTTILNRSLQMK